MDAINLLIGINILATMGANLSAAKSGVKLAVSKFVSKPKTFLQKVPPNIAAFVLLLQIMGVFGIGSYSINKPDEHLFIRTAGLAVFIAFSWLQIWVYKYLGRNYSQDIVILHGHSLITTGPYRLIRHPQYICQVLADLGAGVALMSYFVVPVVVLIELPLFVMRALKEDSMLKNHFKDEFLSYKKKSGLFIPFIG